MKKKIKRSTSLKGKVQEILELADLKRSEAMFLIEDYLGLTIQEFCEEYEVSYSHLRDALMGKRPLSNSLQMDIREAAFKKYAGKKVIIQFED